MPKAIAYGGVVVDDEGRILLRRPTRDFDDYVWTFAKGRPEPGETPEATAQREVREETGYEVEIAVRIPGCFVGGTTCNVYFLMRPVRAIIPPGPETQTICWAVPEEARNLLGKTSNPMGRERDFAVLEAAIHVWKGIQTDGS
jgi:8-oxo-dGTP pyrophosphatase MutT (NUDIX family)